MAEIRELIKRSKKAFLLGLVGIFLFIAILLYGFEPQEQPRRVTFDTKGGGVIFNHMLHVNLKNTLCEECHHNFDDVENNLSADCRGCHYSKEFKGSCQEESIHKRCIGKNCSACHVEGSVNCTFCHNAENFVFVKPPGKMEFDTEGGKVVFDHLTHTSADGYDLACAECHHGYKPENKKSFPMNCRRCHYNKKYGTVCKDEETHARCIGKKCIDCHSDGAEDCNICHVE